MTQLHMDNASHSWHIAERLQQLLLSLELGAALQDMTAAADIHINCVFSMCVCVCVNDSML